MTSRSTVLLFLTALAVALLVACGDDNESPGVSGSATPTGASVPTATVVFPLTLKDDKGNGVTLKTPGKRIVALQPSFVEVLFAIGAGGAVVAADQNTNFPPEAASIPKISGFAPSVEGIAAQNPDLVLIQYDPGGLQDALKALGIPTLFLATPPSLEGVFDQIETLGEVSDHLGPARALLSGLRDKITDIELKIPQGKPGPRVFHEVDNTLYTVGPGSFIHDLYATLQAKNVAEPAGEAFPQMSNEAVIKADPEVIILADEQAGESPQTVAARPGWDAISAVKNRRVYTVDPDIISRPGPRIAEALETLAKDLYPDAFQ